MGDPKRIRKKYKTPRQPLDKNRIENELQLIGKYGLRNMRSVWKHSTMLANFRGNARHLLSFDVESRKIGEQELLGRLQRMGLLSSKEATLDNVLSLQIEDLLERRLQTIVFKKGYACTPYHARQLIVHGHIAIGDSIVKSPSYLVLTKEEKLIDFAQDSPFKKPEHKALPGNVYKVAQAQQEKKFESRRGGKRPTPTTMPPAVHIKQTAKKIIEEELDDVDVLKVAIVEEESEDKTSEDDKKKGAKTE